MSNYSFELIEKLKVFKGWSKQAPVIEFLDKISQPHLTEIKNGKRHLTPAQALQIADEVGIDKNTVLIQLSIEKAKSKDEQTAWSGVLDLVKKSGTTGLAIILTLSPKIISNSAQCIISNNSKKRLQGLYIKGSSKIKIMSI